MKFTKILTSTFILVILLCSVSSCKKDDSVSNNNNNNNGTQTGIVKATVTYSPSNTASYYVYFLESPIEVKLYDPSGKLVATEYLSGNAGTINFGSFNYGNYHIVANGAEDKTNLNTGNTIQNKTLNGSCYVNLNSTQSSCSISL